MQLDPGMTMNYKPSYTYWQNLYSLTRWLERRIFHLQNTKKKRSIKFACGLEETAMLYIFSFISVVSLLKLPRKCEHNVSFFIETHTQSYQTLLCPSTFQTEYESFDNKR